VILYLNITFLQKMKRSMLSSSIYLTDYRFEGFGMVHRQIG
jgi:hypothetical protein